MATSPAGCQTEVRKGTNRTTAPRAERDPSNSSALGGERSTPCARGAAGIGSRSVFVQICRRASDGHRLVHSLPGLAGVPNRYVMSLLTSTWRALAPAGPIALRARSGMILAEGQVASILLSEEAA